MAGSPKVILNNRPVWMECTPPALKIHHSWIYRQEKARLVMELRESSDTALKDQCARVVTDRKWRVEEEVQKAASRLVGRVQIGRAGLGWSNPTCLWPRASKERKDLVVTEIAKMEQDEI